MIKQTVSASALVLAIACGGMAYAPTSLAEGFNPMKMMNPSKWMGGNKDDDDYYYDRYRYRGGPYGPYGPYGYGPGYGYGYGAPGWGYGVPGYGYGAGIPSAPAQQQQPAPPREIQ